jgi:hypothetical protein
MPNLQISRDDLIVSDRSRLFVVARSRPNLPPMAQQMERLWRQVNTGPPPKPLGRVVSAISCDLSQEVQARYPPGRLPARLGSRQLAAHFR